MMDDPVILAELVGEMPASDARRGLRWKAWCAVAVAALIAAAIGLAGPTAAASHADAPITGVLSDEAVPNVSLKIAPPRNTGAQINLSPAAKYGFNPQPEPPPEAILELKLR